MDEEDPWAGEPWWRNGPPLNWRWPVWMLDELLDRVPRYDRETGWMRKGCWGCYPLRLHRVWWRP